MSVLSIVFWALVVAAAAVSYRWGSMIGLVFFMVALSIDALLATTLVHGSGGPFGYPPAAILQRNSAADGLH